MNSYSSYLQAFKFHSMAWNRSMEEPAGCQQMSPLHSLLSRERPSRIAIRGCFISLPLLFEVIFATFTLSQLQSNSGLKPWQITMMLFHNNLLGRNEESTFGKYKGIKFYGEDCKRENELSMVIATPQLSWSAQIRHNQQLTSNRLLHGSIPSWTWILPCHGPWVT